MEDVSKNSTIKEVIDHIKSSSNLVLTSVPGMGLNTLTRFIIYELSKHRIYRIINIYPHESLFNKHESLNNLFLSKYLIDNPKYSKGRVNIQTLISNLSLDEINLVIFFNKIEQFSNVKKYISYVNSIKSQSPKNISVIITSTANITESIESFDSPPTTLIFPGFINDYPSMISSIFNDREIKADVEVINKVFDTTYYHLGLTVSIAEIYKKTGSIPKLDNLLQDATVRIRLSRIHNFLLSLNYNIQDIIDGNVNLNEYGLTKNNILMPILYRYLQNQLDKFPKKFTDKLTDTELRIFSYLESNMNTFSTLDSILQNLDSKNAEELTNWTIYKHINNLNKKLHVQGYKILNKRGRGYKLVIDNN